MNANPRRIEGETARRVRVLVVVNEALDGKKLAEMLAEHDVVAVSSGADALAVISVGRSYDLVLCDLMLSDMGGIELLSRLWCDRPDQAERLVFMSNPQVSPVAQYLLSGISNLCIDVPCDIDGLRALIERRARRPSSSGTLRV
jgi:CheY-like chemotaxis protein